MLFICMKNKAIIHGICGWVIYSVRTVELSVQLRKLFKLLLFVSSEQFELIATN